MVAITATASKFELDGRAYSAAFNRAVVRLFRGAAREFYDKAIVRIPVRTGFVSGAFRALADAAGGSGRGAEPALFRKLQQQHRIGRQVAHYERGIRKLRREQQYERVLHKLKRLKNPRLAVERLRSTAPKTHRLLVQKAKEKLSELKKAKDKTAKELFSATKGERATREAFGADVARAKLEGKARKEFDLNESHHEGYYDKLVENLIKSEKGGTIEGLNEYAKTSNRTERIAALKKAHRERQDTVVGYELTYTPLGGIHQVEVRKPGVVRTGVPDKDASGGHTVADRLVGKREPKEVGRERILRDVNTQADRQQVLGAQRKRLEDRLAKLKSRAESLGVSKSESTVGESLAVLRNRHLNPADEHHTTLSSRVKLEEVKTFRSTRNKTAAEYRREYLSDKRDELLGVNPGGSEAQRRHDRDYKHWLRRRRASEGVRLTEAEQKAGLTLRQKTAGLGRIEFYHAPDGSVTLKTPSSGRNFVRVIIPDPQDVVVTSVGNTSLKASGVNFLPEHEVIRASKSLNQSSQINTAYEFEFSINISYFNINDTNRNRRNLSAPWQAMEAGRNAFNAYMQANLDVIPNLTAFLYEVEYTLHANGTITKSQKKPLINL